MESKLKIEARELKAIIQKNKDSRHYKNLEARGVNIEERFYNLIDGKESIYFHNCDIESVIFSNYEIETALIFSYCNISLIHIEDSKIKNTLTFTNLSDKNNELVNVQIINSEIYNSIEINRLDDENKISLIVKGCTGFREEYMNFDKDISILNANLTFIDIKENILKKGILIENCVCEEVEVENKEIEYLCLNKSKIDDLNIKFDKISTLLIYDCETSNGKIGYSGKYDEDREEKNIIANVDHLRIDSQKPFTILINSGFIKNIDITGIIHKDSNLFIRKVYTRNLNLQYINYGNVHFQGFRVIPKKYYNDNIDRKSFFKIQGADLGKTNFYFCDLDKFEKFSLLGSKISDSFFAGSQFPSKITNEEPYIITYKRTLIEKYQGFKNKLLTYFLVQSEKRVSYSQLKKLFENRGDNIQANIYYSKEMDSYAIALLPKFYLHIPELINIFLNKISSNHGKSWMRALIVTFLSSFSLFIAYISCFENNLSFESESMSYYLEFINPIHKADYIA
jgi:uncharacterized protein YjbI with pentapeptide repeats